MSDVDELINMKYPSRNANIKIPHSVIVRAPGILPMLYMVRELAEELDISERTLRDWLKNGAPHERDSRKRIWINGVEFAQWVQANRKKKNKRKLNDDEAYCLRCNKAVRLEDPQVHHIKGKLIHIKGTCKHCGHTINRGGRRGKQA